MTREIQGVFFCTAVLFTFHAQFSYQAPYLREGPADPLILETKTLS